MPSRPAPGIAVPQNDRHSLVYRAEAAAPPVKDVVAALNELTKLGNVVARNMTDRQKSPLSWRMRALLPGSVVIELEPEFATESTAETLGAELPEQVVAAMHRGIEQLLREAVTPLHFDTAALGAVAKLAKVSANGLGGATIGFGTDVLVIGREMENHARRALGNKPHYAGAITGYLKALDLVGSMEFDVIDEVTGRRVKCQFDQNRIELDAVLEQINRRVTVHGIVRLDRENRPGEIDARQLEAMPGWDDMVPPEKFKGIAS